MKTYLLCFIILSVIYAIAFCVWPEIYILGAQKSGSTSIYSLLAGSKDICRANCSHTSNSCLNQKEIHFFNVPDRYSKGAEYYTSLFPKSQCSGRFVDGTPDYFHTAEVPKRMSSMIEKEIRKKFQFIISLREPIDRDFSMFEHLIRGCNVFLHEKHESKLHHYICANGYCSATAKICHKNRKAPSTNNYNPSNFTEESLHNSSDHSYHYNNLSLSMTPFISYEEYVRLRLSYSNVSLSLLGRGLYYTQLSKFLEVFDRKQIFIISFSSLLKDIPDIADRLSKFLGLSSGFGDNITLPHDNISNGPRAAPVLECSTKRELEILYKDDINELYNMMRNKSNAPPDEPYFEEFGSSKVTCV